MLHNRNVNFPEETICFSICQSCADNIKECSCMFLFPPSRVEKSIFSILLAFVPKSILPFFVPVTVMWHLSHFHRVCYPNIFCLTKSFRIAPSTGMWQLHIFPPPRPPPPPPPPYSHVHSLTSGATLTDIVLTNDRLYFLNSINQVDIV